jgi:hypothetical protein
MKRSHVILGGGVILIALLLIMYFTPLREGGPYSKPKGGENRGVTGVTSQNALIFNKQSVVKPLTQCQICKNKNPNKPNACNTQCK